MYAHLVIPKPDAPLPAPTRCLLDVFLTNYYDDELPAGVLRIGDPIDLSPENSSPSDG